jgi:hypothetical protein
MNHRTHHRGHHDGYHGGPVPLNMDVELLVSSTQNSAFNFRKSSGKERFHGWLWKSSGRFSRWRNQHFVLDGAVLTYYDSFPSDQFVADSSSSTITAETLFSSVKGESTPSGVLRVAHVERSQKSKIAFKVYAVSGKIIDLRAKNEAVCSQWIDHLAEAASLAKRQESVNNSSTSTASSSLSVAYSDVELDLVANLVDKNGWLEVRDKKSRRKLYCVLQGRMLTLYETEEAWAVPVSRAYVTGVEEYSHSELRVGTNAGKNNTKTFILEAKSQDEMHLWLDAFRHVLK